MAFLKNKKNKIVFFSLIATIVASSSFGTVIFMANQKNRNGIEYNNDFGAKSELFHKGTPDTTNAIPSITDHGLKEIEKPILIEKAPEPIPELVPIPPVSPTEPKKEEIKPEIKPELKPKPIPIPKPPVIIEQPKEEIKPSPTPKPIPQPKPEIKKDETEKILEINGVRVKATVTPPKERVQDPRYVKANIANPKPYRSVIVGTITNVEVTDELRKATVNSLKNDKEGLKNYFPSYITDIVDTPESKYFNPDDYIKQNEGVWLKFLDKFKRLLDSPRVTEFLIPGAAEEYKNKQFKTLNRKYAWLISKLDYSKFTKLGKGAEKYLKEGYTASPDNAYINENGELDSYTYSPAPGYNKVTSRLERDNKKRRGIPIKGYYGRTPDQISSGNYPGWDKQDVTKTKFKEFGVGGSDGIRITELTNKNPEEGDLKKATVVEIDASNFQGYAKTKKLIEDLKAKNIEITSYRIKNMGKKDVNQTFKEILSALPDRLTQLELFFDHRATNTASLIALENKSIKELGLYTLGNSLLDDWSINPLSFRKVEWINTIDYNVSKQNKAGADIATRITFNTLAFEESDILKTESDKYKRINEGLSLVYYSRNNEGAFQGNFGPGNDPDHDEGNNSYPTRLDFSRAPSIRSLKGLKFYDWITNSGKKPRKLKNVKFYNNNSWYAISGYDLDNAQFDTVMALGEPGMPPTKIEFSNGLETDRIRITSKEKLTDSALSNLNLLINLSRISRQIEIPQDASSELKSQLESNGYKVSYESDETFN
ncbi:putative immunoglobulin-blocking virulence protein [Metamycoplasma canadense]|uniref:Uncharacterized protein n=1 Tax=Metamycoplasma canadense TaxID=29554 RepID=A0A077L5Z5_9BACT|nr:putative immunoglobulin-blocking virulence protein [Metamycoplasma canadense]BAP39710.1 hypothetical protein MCAN360_0637 [Metamycoplasma canadense]